MSDTPAIPLPADPRHQRFADLLLAGTGPADAYVAAGFQPGKKQTAITAASRLRKRTDVTAYLHAIQARAADASTLTVLEIRRYLARIVRVAVTQIDPEDKTFANHDLIKKVRRKFNTDTDEREYCTEELEKHDPLKAIEIDLKLSGNDPEASALKDLAAALTTIASKGPLPTDQM